MAVEALAGHFDQSGALIALPVSGHVNHSLLTASAVKTFTPSANAVGARFVLITVMDGDVYWRPNANPVVPASDITDGTGSFAMVSGSSRLLRIDGVTTLRAISASAAKVTLEYFS